jgi:ElaA protein
MIFEWEIKKFEDLTIDNLYSILKLRSEIFVVEQNCIFLDIDDIDKKAIHIYSLNKKKECIAYARINNSGDYYKEYVAISRIMIKKNYRRKKEGYTLVNKAISVSLDNFINQDIKISAQKHLEKFYKKLGFKFKGENYIEDGILHCAMYYSSKLK